MDLRQIIGRIKNGWLSFTWFFKRRWYWLIDGFDPQDLWGLDTACAKWLLPRLKKFKQIKHGTPSLCFDDPNVTDDEAHKLAEMKWDKALDEIIDAMQLISEGHDYKAEHRERIKKGLQTFAKYFECLWD